MRQWPAPFIIQYDLIIIICRTLAALDVFLVLSFLPMSCTEKVVNLYKIVCVCLFILNRITDYLEASAVNFATVVLAVSVYYKLIPIEQLTRDPNYNYDHAWLSVMSWFGKILLSNKQFVYSY